MSEELLKKGIKVTIAAVITALMLYLSFIILDIILMLTIAILIAFIFDPIVSYLQKKGVNRVFSILAVFILSIFILSIGFSVLVPKIVTQFNAISKNLTQDNVNTFISSALVQLESYFPFINIEETTNKLSVYLSELIVGSFDNVSQIVFSLFSILAILVIVPFLTFFLLKDKTGILKGIINVMPNKYFEVSYSVLRKIGVQLGRFVRGWIFDAFIVGFLSAVGLTILGIDNSVTIGFIAGVGHLIPYFGPVIGGLPAIIIAIIQFGDLSMLPSILIMFVIVYTFDNGFIQPNIFSKSTDIHPLVIILLILVGSKILGILGMLLAVPIATVLRTAAKEIYFGYKNYRIIKQ